MEAFLLLETQGQIDRVIIAEYVTEQSFEDKIEIE